MQRMAAVGIVHALVQYPLFLIGLLRLVGFMSVETLLFPSDIPPGPCRLQLPSAGESQAETGPVPASQGRAPRGWVMRSEGGFCLLRLFWGLFTLKGQDVRVALGAWFLGVPLAARFSGFFAGPLTMLAVHYGCLRPARLPCGGRREAPFLAALAVPQRGEPAT